MNEPAHVRLERARLMQDWWTGLDEGYHADANLLPAFWSKPLNRLTARERGYFFGRELRIHEGDTP